MPRVSTLATAVLMALAAPIALGQQNPAAGGAAQPAAPAQGDGLEEIVVFGRSLELVGTAEAASEGTVGGADLLVRPMLRVAELLEAVPGMVAVQHSGSGKANQYFLRGFNLDHGTDFTTILDGVPLNFRSHGHGQGYLDINGMIPETVERIDYRKGTYRADVGDFSMAGAAFITTIERFDAPFLAFEGGENGWGRLAAGGTKDLDDGASLTGIVEHKMYDGPWEQPEDLEHTALWGKYRRRRISGRWGSRYRATTHTGSLRSRFPSARSARVSARTRSVRSTRLRRATRSVGYSVLRWPATCGTGSVYAQYYDWSMTSNPTYDAQINQFDKRLTMGGRYERTRGRNRLRRGQHRRGVPQRPHRQRRGRRVRRRRVRREHRPKQYPRGIARRFHRALWRATDSLRVMAGLRGDVYTFDAIAKTPGSSEGGVSDSRVSPKLGLAYALTDNVELYGNWGKGFHSNDARGVVNDDGPGAGSVGRRGSRARRPVRGGDADDHDGVLVARSRQRAHLRRRFERRRAEGRLGARRLRAHVLLEAGRLARHRRRLPGSEARYVDNPDGVYVEGAVENAGQIGFSAVKDKWEASLRLALSRRVRTDARQLRNVRRPRRPSTCAVLTRRAVRRGTRSS